MQKRENRTLRYFLVGQPNYSRTRVPSVFNALIIVSSPQFLYIAHAFYRSIGPRQVNGGALH
jgi:hypothetical protein